MEEKDTQLLHKIRDIFIRSGLKSVTMDDLCRELRISKKTLYQIAEDRSDLVSKVVQSFIAEDKERTTHILARGLHPMEEHFELATRLPEQMRNFKPTILYDINKYYPRAWAMFEEFRKNYIYECVVSNLERGKAIGAYRSDFDTQFVGRLYTNLIGQIQQNEEVFQRMDFRQVLREMIVYHLRAIASPQGLSDLDLIQQKYHF